MIRPEEEEYLRRPEVFQRRPQTEEPSEPSTFLDSNWTWSDFSSWPVSVKFSPAFILGLAIFIPLWFPELLPERNPFASDSCVAGFNYTFQIAHAKQHAEELSTRSWELGTAGEAILELISPEKAVFGRDPFPRGKVPKSWFKLDEGLVYVHSNVRISDGATIVYDNFSVSDPASLGVAAVMIGQHWPGWYQAAGRQKDYLLKEAPRYGNGAISHRIEVEELWSDAVFMFPPFLAYYGVSTRDLDLVREAVKQCELYRDVLMIREGEKRGLWKHIVGPSEMKDEGAWSTGNGWAAYGMARVRATIVGWKKSRVAMQEEVGKLDGWILEVLEGAMKMDDHRSGLLTNYLGDSSWFGETSGTALLTAAAYRMTMFMEAGPARDKILGWADRKRKAVVKHVDEDGVARPAVNPLKHDQREPLDGTSSEGESFLLLMGAAWRDCVCAGVCKTNLLKT